MKGKMQSETGLAQVAKAVAQENMMALEEHKVVEAWDSQSLAAQASQAWTGASPLREIGGAVQPSLPPSHLLLQPILCTLNLQPSVDGRKCCESQPNFCCCATLTSSREWYACQWSLHLEIGRIHYVVSGATIFLRSENVPLCSVQCCSQMELLRSVWQSACSANREL